MDCERFDKVLLSLIYEELDELTDSAAQRHCAQCARCGNLERELRATTAIGMMALEPIPKGFEQRLLEAAVVEQKAQPLKNRLGRAVSVLAGYAMRPQAAMSAILLLMIGSALFLIRPEPGQYGSVQVTERGVPEMEGEAVTIIRLPEPGMVTTAAEPPTAGFASAFRESEPAASGTSAAARGEKNSAPDGSVFADAMAAFTKNRFREAVQLFDEAAAQGGSQAATAELYAARSVHNTAGCRGATPRYRKISSARAGSAVGHDATWRAASCLREQGATAAATENYQALLVVPNYSARAETALRKLGQAPIGTQAAPSASPNGEEAASDAPSVSSDAAAPTP